MRGRLSPAKRAVFFRQFPQEVHVSGVYQRNREVSEYKFFTQAIAIRVEVNKLNLAGGGLLNATKPERRFGRNALAIAEGRQLKTAA